MNRNGHGPYLDHFIAVRSNPADAAALQKDFNARRRRRLVNANVTRPVYLPLVFEMDAAGRTSPYRATTPSLGYDVLILGAIANTADRNITITEMLGERNPLRHGNEDNVYLNVGEYAGQVAGGGGETGIHYFPVPTLVPAGAAMTFEMFKEDTTADAETKRLVLVGVSVFDRSFADRALGLEAAAITRFLERPTPAVTYLKVKFDFNSAIAGGEKRDLFTPQENQPLLVRGIRSSLNHSLIEMGFLGEAPWTITATPIWAIAATGDISHDNWFWFPKPIYLRRDQQIHIPRIVNQGDNGDLDPETDNTITFYCETV